MRKADIVTGGIYGNGKGRYRLVLDEAPWYKLYSGVSDEDNVAYLAIRTKRVMGKESLVVQSPGVMQVCTRASLASWAKEQPRSGQNDGMYTVFGLAVHENLKRSERPEEGAERVKLEEVTLFTNSYLWYETALTEETPPVRALVQLPDGTRDWAAVSVKSVTDRWEHNGGILETERSGLFLTIESHPAFPTAESVPIEHYPVAVLEFDGFELTAGAQS
jgi:hypothetical protein